MKKGRAGTMTHDHKRHGTTTLFAALDVLEGKVTVKLGELSRTMGLPGKPDGIDGSQVETYFKAGRSQEIADTANRM